MPAAAAAMSVMTPNTAPPTTTRKASGSAPEKKYKCQFCNRAFSRSEHRSRHERSRKYNPKWRAFAHARDAGKCREKLIALQIPKNDRSSAPSVEAPSFDETSSSATTAPSTPKTAVCPWPATSSAAPTRTTIRTMPHRQNRRQSVWTRLH